MIWLPLSGRRELLIQAEVTDAMDEQQVRIGTRSGRSLSLGEGSVYRFSLAMNSRGLTIRTPSKLAISSRSVSPLTM